MGLKNFLKEYAEETSAHLSKIDHYYTNFKRRLVILSLIIFSFAYSFFYFYLGYTDDNILLRTVSLFCSITMIYFIPAFIGSFFLELDNESKKNKNNFLDISFEYEDRNYSYSDLQIKQGPGLSLYFFLAFKYLLLMKFVKNEQLSVKYNDNKEVFFSFIQEEYSNIELFKVGTFKGRFNTFFDETNFDRLLKDYRKYIIYLLNDEVLRRHKEIITYLQSLNIKTYKN